MADLLRAAVHTAEIPSLTPKEHRLLGTMASLADDHDGPLLDVDDTVRPGRIGLITRFAPPSVKGGWSRQNIITAHIPVFEELGWIRAVTDPALDGAYQLNLARLARLLDVVEADMAGGDSDPLALAEADQLLPGDFEHPVYAGLREQVDRILIHNPQG
ncbi:hypothetical protein [Corynebacterium hadale]|uniref:hypothetical protein n=1 Tax=Corynebacterium hadale TaxID=2026255 RepID=UPI001056434D|nr:hypothetical protein [Corynebacterium hadale]